MRYRQTTGSVPQSDKPPVQILPQRRGNLPRGTVGHQLLVCVCVCACTMQIAQRVRWDHAASPLTQRRQKHHCGVRTVVRRKGRVTQETAGRRPLNTDSSIPGTAAQKGGGRKSH
ncbi:hypothetical protein TraAM80_06736 [Trypanosoma rangeli]|uniref:Uncharacterized protein n=1 Tax=Trypanosoma rangeli TaxID=5698 RepID=A0A3R7RFX7_TRYRA|nr:uncharacterized protein TraAM80_06736 [Trypanosoma rangeli]RNF01932.1 hypothetical protein TraAM80_06736 [Trypanosoma rangeli]|eukprot:RNF01932.1 hypothetical protein TraAM80_06736 [Trypanosoma rangeli]